MNNLTFFILCFRTFIDSLWSFICSRVGRLDVWWCFLDEIFRFLSRLRYEVIYWECLRINVGGFRDSSSYFCEFWKLMWIKGILGTLARNLIIFLKILDQLPSNPMDLNLDQLHLTFTIICTKFTPQKLRQIIQKNPMVQLKIVASKHQFHPLLPDKRK